MRPCVWAKARSSCCCSWLAARNVSSQDRKRDEPGGAATGPDGTVLPLGLGTFSAKPEAKASLRLIDHPYLRSLCGADTLRTGCSLLFVFAVRESSEVVPPPQPCDYVLPGGEPDLPS